jgi:hypothetical protein
VGPAPGEAPPPSVVAARRAALEAPLLARGERAYVVDPGPDDAEAAQARLGATRAMLSACSPEHVAAIVQTLVRDLGGGPGPRPARRRGSAPAGRLVRHRRARPAVGRAGERRCDAAVSRAATRRRGRPPGPAAAGGVRAAGRGARLGRGHRPALRGGTGCAGSGQPAEGTRSRCWPCPAGARPRPTRRTPSCGLWRRTSSQSCATTTAAAATARTSSPAWSRACRHRPSSCGSTPCAVPGATGTLTTDRWSWCRGRRHGRARGST